MFKRIAKHMHGNRYFLRIMSHSRKTWNVFDVMSETFRDSRIRWYPRKFLFSDTIGSFLALSIAKISRFLWKRHVPRDPNLWWHPWAKFHHFSSKIKLTLFFIKAIQANHRDISAMERARKESLDLRITKSFTHEVKDIPSFGITPSGYTLHRSTL